MKRSEHSPIIWVDPNLASVEEIQSEIRARGLVAARVLAQSFDDQDSQDVAHVGNCEIEAAELLLSSKPLIGVHQLEDPPLTPTLTSPHRGC